MCYMKIKHHLSLKVTRNCPHQLLVENKIIKYRSREPVPILFPKHRRARLAFAERCKLWTNDLKNVIFSDEKENYIMIRMAIISTGEI